MMEKMTKPQVRKEIRLKGQWRGVMVPCKMNPHSPWFAGSTFVFTSLDEFENKVSQYEAMNCGSNEVGKYAAFYKH